MLLNNCISVGIAEVSRHDVILARGKVTGGASMPQGRPPFERGGAKASNRARAGCEPATRPISAHEAKMPLSQDYEANGYQRPYSHKTGICIL
ncbi:hypothetical protein [Fontibacillus phaseoli]|uniref:hypothetical protein n=1 Tax=Fontibacillus phaseoli TaxID=1416533 RepID=UPI000DF2A71C|nr:hypothetical protein [Fontibacillus phaseoli]